MITNESESHLQNVCYCWVTYKHTHTQSKFSILFCIIKCDRTKSKTTISISIALVNLLWKGTMYMRRLAVNQPISDIFRESRHQYFKLLPCNGFFPWIHSCEWCACSGLIRYTEKYEEQWKWRHHDLDRLPKVTN